MSRSVRMVLLLAVVVGVVGVGGYLYLTRDIAAPSTDVQAGAGEIETVEDGGTLFRISQDESQVEFNIFEVLNGSDKTVVGTTNQVAGDLVVNLSNPAESEIGSIAINARTFQTDEDRRDNAIARFILQSENDDYEFITFTPTSITGLPASASVGDTFTLEVTGDLSIAGQTNPVTFNVTTTLEAADRLAGSAETTIQRGDFNLSIPSVPFVADVGEEVTLKLSFVASSVDEA
ncbi:MAG: YceI family protein [Anaerolineae bacterium]|nr:YceI family protein [Anaerolineae bacterium]